MLALWSAVVGCTGGPASSTPDADAPREVPWSHRLPPLAAAPRGFTAERAIVHLHSPWSHDACDGNPLPDGVVNEPCLADLRFGLCEARIDVAFVTDHPAYAADQTFDDLFHHRDGDDWLDAAGAPSADARVANAIHCDDGHTVTWLPGIEDELMPVALDRQVAGEDLAENDRLYNAYDAEAVTADIAAGATVLVAHTEQRVRSDLEMLQDAGLTGVEVFNLHAMFDPGIREEALGLDGLGWLTDIAPFTQPDATGEPDLFVLGVLQAQAPSLAHWDALLARGHATGVAGTDAHQNVLAFDLRDGIRGDAYQRMLRWFTNVLWADAPGPAAAEAALAAGRVAVAFEILGSPVGFDVHLDDAAGAVHEMGSDAPAGTLVVACPTLDPASPRGPDDPEITVRVLKDGVPWKDGCGSFATDGPGAYRVEADIVPYHLRPFLGDDPEPWLHSYPWIYGNAIRVDLPSP